MMLRWTATARSDLREIREYIGKDSKIYAKRMVDRIKKAVERLRRFPHIGSRVEEWDREDFREILVGNYRIIYQVTPDRVRITTILHGARRLPGPKSPDLT